MNNQLSCQYTGCHESGVVCEFEHRRGEMDARWYLRVYGLADALWLLFMLWWRGTAVEELCYCEAHCRELGFCFGCGKFNPTIWSYNRELAEAGLCMACYALMWRPLGDGQLEDGTAVRDIEIASWSGAAVDPCDEHWVEFDDLYTRAEEIQAEEEERLGCFDGFIERLDFSGLD